LKRIGSVILKIVGTALEWLFIAFIFLSFGLTSSKFQTGLVNFVADNFLNNETFYIHAKNIWIGTDGEVDFKGLKIRLDGFELSLRSMHTQLNIDDLFSMQFVGDALNVDGLRMAVLPSKRKVDDEPFSYSQVPFCKFNEVNISNTSLYLAQHTDIDTLLFPSVVAKNIIFNDSILTDTLIYSRGELVFVAPKTERPDYDIDSTNHLLIPNGIPKFHVRNFKVNDLYFNSYQLGESKKNELKDIDVEINGWSNIVGADLQLKHAALTIQDSVRLKLNCEQFFLQADKDLQLDEFHINTSLLTLNIKSAGIQLRDNSYDYSIEVNKFLVSPKLANLLQADIPIFKEAAPKFELHFKANYSEKALNLDQFFASFGTENNIEFSGKIHDIYNLDGIDLNVTKFNTSINVLKKYLAVDALNGIPINEISANFLVIGAIDDMNVESGVQMRNTELLLNARLQNISKKGSKMIDLTVDSKKLSFKDVLNDPDNDLVLFNTQLRSSFELNERLSDDHLLIKLTADSLNKGSLSIPELDCIVGVSKDSTKIEALAEDGTWQFNTTTYDNIFRDKRIGLTGNLNLSTINLSGVSLINGKLEGSYTGDLDLEDGLKSDVHFNDWIYAPDNGAVYAPRDFEIGFTQKGDKIIVDVSSKNLINLTAEVSDSLLLFFKSVPFSIRNVPEFSLSTALDLDSTFVEQFTGYRLGAKINRFSIVGEQSNIRSNIEIETASFNDYRIDKLNFSMQPYNSLYNLDLHVFELTTSFETAKNFEIHTTVDTLLEKVSLNLFADLQNLGDHIEISSAVEHKEGVYSISFNEDQPLQFGERAWKPRPNCKMSYDGNGLPNGTLAFEHEDEMISVSSLREKIELKTNNFNVHNILEEFSNVPFTDATLFSDIQYNTTTGMLNGDILVDEVAIDSIRFGDVNLNFNASGNDQKASLLVDESYGKISVRGNDLIKRPQIDVTLNEVDLSYLTSIGVIDTNILKLKGTANGDVHALLDETLVVQGDLTLQETVMESTALGLYTQIDNQQVIIREDAIRFEDFTLEDVAGNKLLLNGKVQLSNNFPVDMMIVTNEFKVIDNFKSRRDTKGEISIRSNLTVKGDRNGIDIGGKIATLDGGKLDYYYEPTLTLNDNSGVVRFVSSGGEIAQHPSVKKSDFSLGFNVDVEVGSTDIYVLLSKTSNEYLRMRGQGALSVIGKNGVTPEVYGSVKSNLGHVYYELPVVSTIQLDIKETELLWNGDLENPTITFIGEEVFMIAPNEVSAQMQEKNSKIPVNVSVIVPSKPLSEFELNFNLTSTNQEAQDLFASLPEETRSNYALDLLTFGKINRDSDAESNSSTIVDKMNEISRRNLKESDLRFSYDSYASDDINAHGNIKSFGYSYSKRMLEDKIRITIGGALNWGGSGEEQSHLFGNVALEYVLVEEPTVLINVKKTDVYNGPIEGETTVSSVGLQLNIKFKNLFKKKRTNQPKEGLKSE
jgi:hypothetical protein